MTHLTGNDAIEYAKRHGLTLSKYTDPTEEAREGLSVDEALEIAKEDPSLVYIDSEYLLPALKAGATDDTAALTVWGLAWGKRAIKAEHDRAKLIAALRQVCEDFSPPYVTAKSESVKVAVALLAELE